MEKLSSAKLLQMPKSAKWKKLLYLDLDETLVHTQIDDENGANSLSNFHHRLEIEVKIAHSEADKDGEALEE